MKIQNNVTSAWSPNFKAFRIEEPQKINGSNDKQSVSEKKEFRGTERFLFKETALIQKAKKEIGSHSFPEPMEKIIDLIKRQENNPYDLVMFAEEGTNPEEDKVFLAIKDPAGNLMGKREVFNAVNCTNDDDGNKYILSHFYKLLNIGEKLANKFNNADK